LKRNRLACRTINEQSEDVWPGVVAHDVEVVLGAYDLVEIQISDQQGLVVIYRSGKYIPEWSDNAASAIRN
jgi:hypothetical protein